jgi:hypothetical protein
MPVISAGFAIQNMRFVPDASMDKSVGKQNRESNEAGRRGTSQTP